MTVRVIALAAVGGESVRQDAQTECWTAEVPYGFVSTSASEGGAMKTRMLSWLARVALSLVRIHFKDGSTQDANEKLLLENGEWKITLAS